MSIQLSGRVNNIRQSPSIAAKKRVTELQAQGRDIIDFTIGEPDLDTPEHIVEAAVEALRNGNTHYTPTAGVAFLRKSIARKMTADTGVAYESEQVIVGSGAKQIIHEAFMATLDAGDEVIVPAPYWVSYPDMVNLAGGQAITVPCYENTGFKLTPQALEAAITPRTRWLVLNSPNNPSGAVYEVQEIAAIAQVLDAYSDVMVMTDDIYEALVYDACRHANVVSVAPSLAPRTLLINGFSKSYAMTGWRVGYAAGPTTLVNAISKLITQSTTCVSSISQAGAVAALCGSQDFQSEALKTYAERRDRMCEAIASIDGIECKPPQGAFYLFPNVNGLMGKLTPSGQRLNSTSDLVMYLLEAENVAVMDGSAYGLSPYLRLSFATSLNSIEQGCRRIENACAQLN